MPAAGGSSGSCARSPVGDEILDRSLGLPFAGPGRCRFGRRRYAAGQRAEIAITFDDLPAVSVPAGETCDLAALKNNTTKLLATLTARAVPVVGFVTEGRICKSLGPEALPSLHNIWLDAGAELETLRPPSIRS